MEIIKTAQSRLNAIDYEKAPFGEIFTDHMFSLEYSDGAWHSPKVIPYGELGLLPSICSLHYGQIVFEGFKAFCTKDGTINIFRPDRHHQRLNVSCRRLCIPEIGFDDFMNGLQTLLRVDRAWIPSERGSALYVRPVIFATESTLSVRPANAYRLIILTAPVGLYFDRSQSIKLITASDYVRAVKGGLGAAKTPANYAAGLRPIQEARERGFAQILWLDGVERRYIEEAGMMNIFFHIDDELVTPPSEGTILDGVTRDTVIQLAQRWEIPVVERKISIEEVIQASQQRRLKEAFGTGTAAVILSVGGIQHHDTSLAINEGQVGPLSRRFYDEITALQYGEQVDECGWCFMIEDERVH